MKTLLTIFLGILSLFPIVHAQNLQLQWAKQIGSNKTDDANSVIVDASSNVYTLGTFSDTVDFDPGAGVFNLTSESESDRFISKLDASGNFVWAIPINANGRSVNSIEVDGFGNIYVLGDFTDTVDFDHGSDTFNLIPKDKFDYTLDTYISKIDAAGNFLWAKQISGLTQNSIIMTVDVSGNVYATGSFGAGVDFDPGPDTFELYSITGAAFILKLDASGNFAWAKKTTGNTTFSGKSIRVDSEGNVYVSGNFSYSVDFDLGSDEFILNAANGSKFLLKMDMSGNFKSAQQSTVNSDDKKITTVRDASLNKYIIGTFEETLDFDPGAGIFKMTSVGKSDIYIAKFDSAGNFTTAYQIGGTSIENGNSITMDKSGSIYCTGSFSGTVDFDLGTGIYNLTSAGQRDVFIMKLIQTPNEVNESKMIASSFHAYPNPGSESVTLHFGKQLTNATLQLLNSLGQTVLQHNQINAESQNIDVTGIVKGIYFIEVNDGGNISRMKFVKD